MKILSFDIEDWFHILDNESTKTSKEWLNFESRLEYGLETIFELLDETNQKATFFCLGWVAEKYPQLIKKIDQNGYEIGSHSHLHQLVYEQKPNEFEKDLSNSLDTIEGVIGKKVRMYRSPGFSLTDEVYWAFEILAKNGIEIDSSIFPAKRSHGGVQNQDLNLPFLIKNKHFNIKELPLNTLKILGRPVVFSGGGYFRVIPSALLKNLFGNTDYLMTYFHPRDFDSGQPILKELSVIRKFKSYYGIKSAKSKLLTLLQEFDFVDFSTVEKQINWEKVEVLAI